MFNIDANPQGYLDRWLVADAPDAYTPIPDGMRLLSNGYGFFEALSIPPLVLCKPELALAPVDVSVHIEYYGATSTPPDTPASTPPLAPSPTPTPSILSMPSPSPSERRSPSPPPVGAISKERARELIEAYVEHAPWFEAQAVEAHVGDDGVPPCALQLARPGESVYRCFVDSGKDRRGQPVYSCSACPFKSDRLHRVVGHQRSKRGHRPFVCPDEGWYAHPSNPPPSGSC